MGHGDDVGADGVWVGVDRFSDDIECLEEFPGFFGEIVVRSCERARVCEFLFEESDLLGFREGGVVVVYRCGV